MLHNKWKEAHYYIPHWSIIPFLSQVSQSLCCILCLRWWWKAQWHVFPVPSPPALLPPSPGSSTKAHYRFRQTGTTCLHFLQNLLFFPVMNSVNCELPWFVPRITVLPNGVLQIHNVQLDDAGQYRCVATNIGSRLKSREATLTVTKGKETTLTGICEHRREQQPIILYRKCWICLFSFSCKGAGPKPRQRPRIIAGPQNVTVSVHQTVVLECVATGNPCPIISWSRADSKPIDVYNAKVLGNGNLVITDVSSKHSGVYLCRATTPGTRNYTIAAANLTVQGTLNFEAVILHHYLLSAYVHFNTRTAFADVNTCTYVSVLWVNEWEAVDCILSTFFQICFSTTNHCWETWEPNPSKSRHCKVYVPSWGSAPTSHQLAKEWGRGSLKWKD